MVRRASRWKCCHRAVDGTASQIYLPECDDPDFVACGVYIVSNQHYITEPRMDLPFALLHKSLTDPLQLEVDSNATSYMQSGGVNLKLVPSINTLWPATVELIGQAYFPKPQLTTGSNTTCLSGLAVTAAAVAAAAAAAVPQLSPMPARAALELQLLQRRQLRFSGAPLCIRNTFIDVPTLLDEEVEDFYVERAIHSWPPSPRRWTSPPTWDSEDEVDVNVDAGAEAIHHAGAAPAGEEDAAAAGLLSEDGEGEEDEEAEGSIKAGRRRRRRRTRARGRAKRNAAFAAAAAADRDAARPAPYHAIMPFLVLPELQTLASACQTLQRAVGQRAPAEAADLHELVWRVGEEASFESA